MIIFQFALLTKILQGFMSYTKSPLNFIKTEFLVYKLINYLESIYIF
jgi:hypothetical protein